MNSQSHSKKYTCAAIERERAFLHPKAAFSSDHNRRLGPQDDHRLPYKRDVDRIVHSKAYRRYVDKTQVVYLVDNDHITHRGLHVQLVSNFARGIAEILKLNVDLVEAIALGHDVGHPPFGHEGEEYLSELSQEYGEGPFAHPWQSCRLFSEVEPLHLGFAVYDGFLCHDGGSYTTRLFPHFGKTWEEHDEELRQKQKNPNLNLAPATLEGCLVKICDTMSYLGRDIEDAVSLGIIQRSDVPHTFLGTSNGEILSALACDLIDHSFGEDFIAISEGAMEALAALRKFNFENIYVHPKLKVESKKIERGYRLLFELLLEDYEKKAQESLLWQDFLSNKRESYLNSTSPVRKVTDHIAGMTDHYFVRMLEKWIVPAKIKI